MEKCTDMRRSFYLSYVRVIQHLFIYFAWALANLLLVLLFAMPVRFHRIFTILLMSNRTMCTSVCIRLSAHFPELDWRKPTFMYKCVFILLMQFQRQIYNENKQIKSDLIKAMFCHTHVHCTCTIHCNPFINWTIFQLDFSLSVSITAVDISPFAYIKPNVAFQLQLK